MDWIIKKIDGYLYKKYIQRKVVVYQNITHINEMELVYMKDREDYPRWLEHHKREAIRAIAEKMYKEGNIVFDERNHNFGGLSLIAKVKVLK